MPAVTILMVVAALGALAITVCLLPSSDAGPVSFHSAVGMSTTEEAHQVWQDHAECVMALCPAKAAAYWALVDDGKIVPDARVTR
ncbi:hypothetical protein [Nocardia sp. R7R-8]|uniref:hypothetical protein n=1 Tax=Nocardia sp. R7R-8 TaxID=3459304 RepID=UPI00403D6B66